MRVRLSQDGNILCWRFNDSVQRFEPAASLTGHTKAVVCMQCSPSQEHLVSGSMDTTIRVRSDGHGPQQCWNSGRPSLSACLCWLNWSLVHQPVTRLSRWEDTRSAYRCSVLLVSQVWDVRTLACLHVLDASSSGSSSGSGSGSVVMGVAFWQSFLLSCSLDGSVKV